MVELAKFVGGISWAVGVILLFVLPTLAIPVLLLALVATIWVRSKDKERKHAELLEATKAGAGPEGPATSADERLAELKRLRAAGTISDEEYEAKRREIIDSL